LEERNRNLPEGSFKIPKAEMDRYIPLFQPPTSDELVPKLESTEEMVTEEPEAPEPEVESPTASPG